MNEQKDNSGETFFVSLFTLRNQFTMINLHKKVSPVPLTSETHKKTHSVSSEKRTKILSTPFQNNNYFFAPSEKLRGHHNTGTGTPLLLLTRVICKLLASNQAFFLLSDHWDVKTKSELSLSPLYVNK